jgi:hypothetical protein
MWQTYKAMRERGEIAMKTVGSSAAANSANGNGSSSHTPAVEAVVVDEEDNGDGEAA